MDINEFSDLSDFTLGEIDKIGDFIDGVGPSKKLIKYMNNQIMKYAKLYSKPLFKAEKQKIKILEAIDTMPHGPIWKLLNFKLWNTIKDILENQELESNEKLNEINQEEPEKQVYYPVIVKESSVPEIYEEDEEEQE